MSLWHPRFPASSAPGFSSLFRMLDDFDRYAQQQLGGAAATSVTSFSPKFDVAEHDKEYVLQGELPGVAPENVEIEFTDNQTMVVRGHAERTHTEGDRDLLEAPEAPKQIEGGAGEAKKETHVSKAKKGEEKATAPAPRYWVSERSYGEFSRVLKFPTPVDPDSVQAKFKNGILDIRAPKAEKKGGRKITLQQQ